MWRLPSADVEDKALSGRMGAVPVNVPTSVYERT